VRRGDSAAHRATHVNRIAGIRAQQSRLDLRLKFRVKGGLNAYGWRVQARIEARTDHNTQKGLANVFRHIDAPGSNVIHPPPCINIISMVIILYLT
jgi:hypothetical protein